MLKRLESAGWIKRSRSMEDERKVIISLTSKGLKLKEKALGVPAELFAKQALPWMNIEL
jgi:DNA-binding MarR family transcriptional regulator